MPSPFNEFINKTDPSFSEENLSSYHLTIHVSHDRALFLFLDAARNKYIRLTGFKLEEYLTEKQYIAKLVDLIRERPYLALPSEKVMLMVDVEKSTLIPSALFNEDETEAYSKLNFEVGEGCHVYSDRMAMLDAVNIYPAPADLRPVFREIYSQITILCSATALIETILMRYKNHPIDKQMFVHVRDSYADILIMDGPQLLYFNIFPYKTGEDFVYYIIYVLEQLEINPEEADLVLMGYIDRKSELFEMAFRYIRNIRFEKRSDAFEYSYVFSELPSHRYLNLLNARLCAL